MGKGGLAGRTHPKKQLQQRLRLLLPQPHNPLCKPRIHKQRLLPRRGVHPHDGMFGPDRLAAHKLAVPARVLGLGEPAVLGAEALEQRADGRRQPRVRGRLRHPRGVAARRGDGEERQGGDARGLPLVGDVRVVAGAGEALGGALVAVLVVGAEVDVVELEVAADG